jgi:hypothetical protein
LPHTSGKVIGVVKFGLNSQQYPVVAL